MKIRQVLNCSFSTWYPIFKHITIKSKVITLPEEVVDYLLSDGIVLPQSAQNGCPYRPSSDRNYVDTDSDDEIEWDVDINEDIKVPHFPELEESVKKAIRKLGGKVFAKLNWSSPRDATWVALNNSLICTNLGDIFLLLKSSDFVTHDLSQPFNGCDDSSESPDVLYDLVLRQWQDISQSGEYRCFVSNGTVLAISQRAHCVHFPHIAGQKDDVIRDIVRFHATYLTDAFPDSEYVFDVYRKSMADVLLIDFNPFGPNTDSLLFTWPELKDISATHTEVNSPTLPIFRYMSQETGVQPNEFQVYARPKDFVDLYHGEDPNKLLDLLKLRDNVAGNTSDEES